MSGEKSLFEQMGGTYIGRDGLLQPNLIQDQEAESTIVGKYGYFWMEYMEEEYPDRYGHLVRMRQLRTEAAKVNEEAQEMLERIVEQYLKKHKPKNPDSTMEMQQLREQARAVAEEEVYETVVYRFR